MLIPSANAWSILGGVILLLLLIRLSDRWINGRVQRTFSVWARNNRVRYSPVDRFQLAARIQEHLPHPGAADVVVRDVMYRTDDQNHLYLFTVYYRTGTILGQTRHRIVIITREAKERPCDYLYPIYAAEIHNHLQEYETLIKKFSSEESIFTGN